MTNTKAINIDDTYRFCNPDQPLDADDPRYIDLSSSRGVPQIAKSMTRNINRTDEHSHLQILFTGHRGSGKTTELLRLKKELEAQEFFTIYLDVEDILDLGSLSYLDVLVAIAKQIQVSLYEQKIPLSEKLLEDIAGWFSEHIITDDVSTKSEVSVETGVKSGIKIPFVDVFAKLTANIKAGSSRRETIRHNLKREMSIFIQKLNTLIGEARQAVQNKGFKDLVIIVDGLEKMHYELNGEGVSTHSELFVRHGEQLRSPECHIIYTVPISLAYNQNLGADFDELRILPMVKMDEDGIKLLVDIVKQRVDIKQVFDSVELLETLAKNSGGVVRDLMRLVRMSTETDEEKIGRDEINYAISTLGKQYARLIKTEDIEIFKKIKETKQAQSGEATARLLNLRLVLEYENGQGWVDLHPITKKIEWVDKELSDSVG